MKITKKKSLVTILHGMDFFLGTARPWKRWQTRFLLSKSHGVIVNSGALESAVRRFCPGQKNIRIARPCLSPFFVSRVSVPEKKIRGAEWKFLTVGRLVPRKGHDMVLRALAVLRERCPEVRLRYVIVGDGPQRQTLQRLAQSLRLGGIVMFALSVSDRELPTYYQEADVFVMPTRAIGADREGFGTVYLEAAAFGLPVIAGEVPGVDEAVLREETGILIPPGDGEALAFAMERLIRNPALAAALGAAGRRRVEKEFTPEKQFLPLRIMFE